MTTPFAWFQGSRPPARRDLRLSAIVLGSDCAGSAIARRLHLDGMAVTLIDAIDPPWPRRGMGYADAWYLGVAELESVPAVFCSSVRSIPTLLASGTAIAATTWSWAGVAAAIAPVAIVDTRRASQRFAKRLARAVAGPMLIEVLPGAVVGPEFDVPVLAHPAQPGEGRGQVHAPCDGYFTTGHAIGDEVHRGEPVGAVGAMVIVAPIHGCLRGLPARGARIAAGSEVLDVDPRGVPRHCFGVDVQALAIADAVSKALAHARMDGGVPAGAVS